MERDHYAEIREIAEDWIDDGISKDDMLTQLETLVEDLEEE